MCRFDVNPCSLALDQALCIGVRELSNFYPNPLLEDNIVLASTDVLLNPHPAPSGL